MGNWARSTGYRPLKTPAAFRETSGYTASIVDAVFWPADPPPVSGGGGGGGPITLTGVATATGANGFYAAVLPTYNVGDLLVAFISTSSAVSTNNNPSGWTQLIGSTSSNLGIDVWYKFAGASESAPTWTGNFTFWGVAMLAYGGVNTTTPFEYFAAGEEPFSDTSDSIGAAMDNTGDFLVLTVYNHLNATAVDTPPTSMTERVAPFGGPIMVVYDEAYANTDPGTTLLDRNIIWNNFQFNTGIGIVLNTAVGVTAKAFIARRRVYAGLLPR